MKETDRHSASRKSHFVRVFICSLLAALPLLGAAPDVFQATLRGDATSGVAFFSPTGPGAFSGKVVIFLKGRQFQGTSQGRVDGNKLIISFEASAVASGKGPARLLSGSFEATGAPARFTGAGTLLLSPEKKDATKSPSPLPIKVSGIQMPKVTGR